MPRTVLPESQIHPAIRDKINAHHLDIVNEVQQALAAHRVLVVGMAGNPFPKKACKVLTEAGIAHHYLQYGSYFSLWRRRNALKMWTGWPTFPMVFVNGVLVGGFSELQALLHRGELQKMLA